MLVILFRFSLSLSTCHRFHEGSYPFDEGSFGGILQTVGADHFNYVKDIENDHGDDGEDYDDGIEATGGDISHYRDNADDHFTAVNPAAARTRYAGEAII